MTDQEREQAPAAIAAVAALEDALRRGMYDFIRRQRRPVTRDEAAAQVGISRKLAGFHLDKLVGAGVLTVATATGKRRVGRTPKAYRAADTDLRISIPERQHDVLAGILLDALLEQTPQEDGAEAVRRVARERGTADGKHERAGLGRRRLGPERALTAAEPILARHGYEPDRVSARCIRLRSCPFHPVTAQAPELVCGLNQAYLTGFVAGLDSPAIEAVLRPEPGECCVELRATPPAR